MIDETTLAQQISPHFAGYMNNVCHHVTARSVERFTGPFNHTLNNEMLIIGNTADVSSHSCLTENDMLMVKKPITPVQNAKKVNDLLHHSSRLVIQDGSGVSRLVLISLYDLFTRIHPIAWILGDGLSMHGKSAS